MNRYILIFVVLLVAVGYGYLQDNPDALKPAGGEPEVRTTTSESLPAEASDVEEGDLTAVETGETLE